MRKPDLQLTREQADEIVAHCRACFPNEACGILGMKDGEIVKVFKMTNAKASPVKYALVGQEQLAVQNRLYENDWDNGGVFHSHTRTEAYPSPTDVKEAVDDVPYVIVSLADDPPSIRAFWIKKTFPDDTEGDIEEIPVVVIG